MTCKPRQLNKFISLLSVSVGGALSFSAINTYRGDEKFYSKILMPFVAQFVDPELAHDACIFLTKHRLIKCRDSLEDGQSEKLKTTVFGKIFANPIGLAAGFDKNAQAVPGLGQYGFGFVEVGTVTPEPQEGNPKKRIFRNPQDRALINRCGFNNRGLDHVIQNLSEHSSHEPMLLGLNLGKNKTTESLTADYLIGLEKSKDLDSVDYLVINISSPNTPGLRQSQDKANLEKLLDDILSRMNKLSIRKPLLVKVAPDLSDTQIKDIAGLVMKKRQGEAKVSGIILTNTTVSRPSDKSNDSQDFYKEQGGLSGQPLRDMSSRVIREFYKLTNGQIPIIGVGGVATGLDAYEKIKAGASLVQLYTSLTYEGPPVVNKIKRELVGLLERDRLNTISDAVGLDHRKKRD